MQNTTDTPNYWEMSDADLAAEWREVLAVDYSDDEDGEKNERFSFVEDAVLQRIGAPESANSDDPGWFARMNVFAATREP